MKENEKVTVAVLGAGNIGKAVAAGVGARYPYVRLYNRSTGRLKDFDVPGVAVRTTDLGEALDGADIVAICVEGDAVEPVMHQAAEYLAANNPVIVSCAAASTLAQLSALARDYTQEVKVARVLPNVAAHTGHSTSLFCSVGLDESDKAAVREVFGAIGEVYDVAEKDFGAAMAISSCGIANVFRYVRAAMEAGVELGLSPDLACKLAAGSLGGACSMIESTGKHPEALVDSVTTPGGLTIRGINTMEANGFSVAVIAGIKAACKH